MLGQSCSQSPWGRRVKYAENEEMGSSPPPTALGGRTREVCVREKVNVTSLPSQAKPEVMPGCNSKLDWVG